MLSMVNRWCCRLSVVEILRTTTDDIAVEDQEKEVEQCTTYYLGTIENGDAVGG